MTDKIQNEKLKIEVERHGAELCHLVCNGREYLWGADPVFWKRHAPVLFPIVGSVWNGEYHSGGETFRLGQHGMARDMDFSPVEAREDSLWYELRSNPATLEKYPYDFRLVIGYRLEGAAVRVVWRVINPSDREMSFQIGAHPAFYWPVIPDGATASCDLKAMEGCLSGTTSRGWFKFDSEKESLVSSVIRGGGCVSTTETKSVALDGGFLHLDTSSFDEDALIFENGQVHSVTLCDEDRNPYLTLSFDAPVVGLWSPPHRNAPFVCVEPWYGRTDRMEYSGDFEQKEWIQHLAPKGTFETSYLIKIEEID